MRSGTVRGALWATLISLTVVPAAGRADEKPEIGKWVPLFNGKNLDGWTVKIKGYDAGENFGNTFRVEDGLMKVGYDQYDQFRGRFGHIFYNKSYSDYVLRVEYRFVGNQVEGGAGWAKRNSGIMIHGQTPESMKKDQDFPVSVEVQLLGGGPTGQRPTANVCTPGTHVVIDGKLVKRHCNSSTSDTFRGDQWVTVEVEVHGNRRIEHRVNGKTVFVYSQPQLDDRDANAKPLIVANGGVMLSGGTISLQSESHPVEFRKIELRELKERR